MANLLDALGKQVLVGDGAVAAYLYAEGVPLGRSFEGLNLTEPDRVTAAHRVYLEAGAEVIATNSFAANRSALKRHGLDDKANEINWKAAKLALGEVGKSGAWVAGCIGPSGLAQAERNGIGAKEMENLFRSQAGGADRRRGSGDSPAIVCRSGRIGDRDWGGPGTASSSGDRPTFVRPGRNPTGRKELGGDHEKTSAGGSRGSGCRSGIRAECLRRIAGENFIRRG